ncbi:MAG: 50S ribosomal protein L35 [Legionellales bacterium]|nr:50S ribosomal protein L35 [Legionellales bacterium]
MAVKKVKVKSHRGACKRFKKRGNGGIKFRSKNRAHILTKKAPKRKRQLRGQTSMKKCDIPAATRLLDGC